MDYLTQLLELGEEKAKIKKSSPLVPPKPPEHPKPPFHAQSLTLETFDLFDETPRTPKNPEPPQSWCDRGEAYWARVRESVAPGAVAICQTLHAFSFLFDLLHRSQLPSGDVTAIIGEESILFEDVREVLRAIEKDWTERATSCNATQRALSEGESAALDRACQLLEWLSASYSPDGWLDLNARLELNFT